LNPTGHRDTNRNPGNASDRQAAHRLQRPRNPGHHRSRLVLRPPRLQSAL